MDGAGAGGVGAVTQPARLDMFDVSAVAKSFFV